MNADEADRFFDAVDQESLFLIHTRLALANWRNGKRKRTAKAAWFVRLDSHLKDDAMAIILIAEFSKAKLEAAQ